MASRRSKKAGKSILLLRFSAMGDVAMTAAAVHEFAAAYPQHEFTMVSRLMFGPLFDEVENISFVSADFNGRHKGLRGLFRLFLELRRRRPDVVVDMHDVLRTKVLCWLFRLSGTPVKVFKKGRCEKRQLTRRRHKKLHPIKTMHERYVDVLLAAVGNEQPTVGSVPLDATSHHPPPCPPSFGIKKVGIAPFAKYKEKTYPLERMEKIVAHFAQMKDVEVYLFGGGTAEKLQLAEWENKYAGVVSLAGKLPFSEELFHLSCMDVVVCMDSANMHLASFMCVPVVSVWGATHPYAGFTGWQQSSDHNVQIDLYCRPCSVFGNKPCYRKDHACMDIPESTIIEKVIDVLQSGDDKFRVHNS